MAFLEIDCMSDEEDDDVVNDVAVTIKVTIPSWRSEAVRILKKSNRIVLIIFSISLS